MYAWVIIEDNLFKTGVSQNDDSGISGPSEATDEMIERARNEGHVFRLYDDDGEFYYRGRIWSDDMEEDCFAPFDDFGEGWAGCTEVKYQGHPEWDCG